MEQLDEFAKGGFKIPSNMNQLSGDVEAATHAVERLFTKVPQSMNSVFQTLVDAAKIAEEAGAIRYEYNGRNTPNSDSKRVMERAGDKVRELFKKGSALEFLLYIDPTIRDQIGGLVWRYLEKSADVGYSKQANKDHHTLSYERHNIGEHKSRLRDLRKQIIRRIEVLYRNRERLAKYAAEKVPKKRRAAKVVAKATTARRKPAVKKRVTRVKKRVAPKRKTTAPKSKVKKRTITTNASGTNVNVHLHFGSDGMPAMTGPKPKRKSPTKKKPAVKKPVVKKAAVKKAAVKKASPKTKPTPVKKAAVKKAAPKSKPVRKTAVKKPAPVKRKVARKKAVAKNVKPAARTPQKNSLMKSFTKTLKKMRLRSNTGKNYEIRLVVGPDGRVKALETSPHVTVPVKQYSLK